MPSPERTHAQYLRDARDKEARAEFVRALREASGTSNPSTKVIRMGVERLPTGGFRLTERASEEQVLG